MYTPTHRTHITQTPNASYSYLLTNKKSRHGLVLFPLETVYISLLNQCAIVKS